MEEIVKLKKYPDYGITTNGKVYSLPREIFNGKVMFTSKLKELKPNILAKGYLQVYLYENKKKYCVLVHRLVAETFIENPNNYNQINHKDGNKQNNDVNNLEWCNNSMNQIHAWKTGLQKRHNCGWGTTRPTQPVASVDDNGNVIKRYPSIISASMEIFGYPGGGIIRSIKRNGKCAGRKFIKL